MLIRIIDEARLESSPCYMTGTATSKDGKEEYTFYVVKEYGFCTLFKTLESFITYIQTGKEDEFSMKFDGYEAMAKHINEGGLKLPECDWCGERIDGRGSYYANGNQEGRLCHDCHVKEISYSNDMY